MTPTGLALLLLLTPAFGDLGQALDAARAGEALEGRVPASVAREAADAIVAAPDDEALSAALAVAEHGARDAVPGALVKHLERQGGGARAALVALRRVDPARRPRPARPAELLACLEARLLDGDAPEEARAAAAALLAWAGDAPQVAHAARSLLLAEDPVSLRALLQDLALCAREGEESAALLAELSRLEAPAEVDDALVPALATLARDAAAAARLLELGRAGEWGTRGCLLRAARGLPPAAWGPAAALVRPLVEALAEDEPTEQDPAWVAAVLAAGADLLVGEVVPLLPRYAGPGSPRPVRVEAVRGLAALGRRDGPTIDALLALLQDPQPEVAAAAHEALRRKTGEKLSLRVELWRRWREGQELEGAEEEPEETAARLERERALRARLATRRRS